MEDSKSSLNPNTSLAWSLSVGHNFFGFSDQGSQGEGCFLNNIFLKGENKVSKQEKKRNLLLFPEHTKEVVGEESPS